MMRKQQLRTIVTVATLLFLGVEARGATIIVGGTLIDGTGGPPIAGSVKIEGGRITALGVVSPASDDTVIDATGRVVAPGFIDTHSHHDRALPETLAAKQLLREGVTTIVVGQDGSSHYPLRDFFREQELHPAAVNVASYSGHGTLRGSVMGENFKRHATDAETLRMGDMLEEDMRAGAIGLATGLEYDPGIYSAPEEIVTLAKRAASFGGRYISHIRSEDRWFWQAIEEIISIGNLARLPVQISHTKLAMVSLWGQAPRLLARLDEARRMGVEITADIYPYEYWQSTMTVLFPNRDFENRAEAELALTEIVKPEGLTLSQFDPEPRYVGKNLAEISLVRGTDAVTTLIELIRMALHMEETTGHGSESVIGVSMRTSDIKEILSWPYANVCSDGSFQSRHPRGAGTYPRILGRYVRDEKLMPLTQAIYKMSGLPARNLGLQSRGLLKVGMQADVIVFDPARVIDRATPQDPQLLSEGVNDVFVGGVMVLKNGEPTGKLPGHVIRRGD